jgi:hypothetical protein
MKALAHVLLSFTAAATLGCGGQAHIESSAPSPLTMLDVDQVNALLPFMVNRKGAESRHRAIDVPGQKLLLRETTQEFAFDVWIDDEGHPVPPAGAGDSISALKRPVLHHGSFVSVCTSVCEPATSDGTCDQLGCQPVAGDVCGCTPPDCTGCIPLSCENFVHGAVAGTVMM